MLPPTIEKGHAGTLAAAPPAKFLIIFPGLTAENISKIKSNNAEKIP